MQVYRCGMCRKVLMTGTTFCPNCEVFYSCPVPSIAATDGPDVYVDPIDTSAYRVNKAFRNFAVLACIVSCLCLAAIFGGDQGTWRLLEAAAHRPPGIAEAMQADFDADRLGTVSARMKAADEMIVLSAHCNVRHRPAKASDEMVTLISSTGLSPRKARSRAEFAIMLFADVRDHYMDFADAHRVKVAIYDPTGRCMAIVNGANS